MVQGGDQALVLPFDRRLVSHGLKKAIVPVVVEMRPQEPCLIPDLHRVAGDPELLGQLRQGKHTTVSKPIVSWKQAIGFLDVPDTRPLERLPIDCAHALVTQNGCDLAVGVEVKQPIHFGHKMSRIFTQLMDRGRQSDCLGRASLEADLSGDSTFLCKGHVLDEQPYHPLALPAGGPGIIPKARKIPGQCQNLGLLLLTESLRPSPPLLFEGFQCFLVSPELSVPLPFEFVGHKPVVGVDLHVATSGEICFVAESLDVLLAQPFGFLSATRELLLDRKGHLQAQGSDGLDEQRSHGQLDTGAGNPLADRLGSFDAVALAHIVRHQASPDPMIAHGHPIPAPAAHYNPLQQGRAFARRAALALCPMGLSVFPKPPLVFLELLQGNVADMCPGKKNRPFFPGQFVEANTPVQVLSLTRAAIEEPAGIAVVARRLRARE